jgi:hypothetical protein
MASGLKLLNVDSNTTIHGIWDVCGCCCSTSGYVTCTSIEAHDGPTFVHKNHTNRPHHHTVHVFMLVL